MPEVNIKRIRNLDTENTMSGSLLIPVDSNSYGVEAKKVSMSVISDYIIGDLSLTGLTDVEFSNVQVDDILIYQGGGLWGITGYTDGGSGIPIIGDEPEIIFRDDSAPHKYNASSGLTFDGDILYADAIISTTSGHSFGISEYDTTIYRDEDNLVIGNQYDNVILGNIGTSDITGQKNIVAGFDGGSLASVLGNDNIVIGTSVSVGSGSYNNSIKIGGWNGAKMDGDQCVIIGYAAGYLNVQDLSDKNIYIGSYSGYLSSGATNLSVGYSSGLARIGESNTMYGEWSGCYMIGDKNLAMGQYSGSGATITRTVMFGMFSGAESTTKYSMFFGDTTGYKSDGLRNLFIGYGTGRQITGSNNVIIGYLGAKSVTGNNNVIIGNYAEYEGGTMSNKLIIATTGSTADFGAESPPHTAKELIYGEFDNYYLRFNAHVKINQFLELNPVASGTTVNNSFFVDEDDDVLKWRDNSGDVSTVSLT